MAKAHSGVAWVVGVGASAGLGSALARRFAKGGLTVALTGRSEARLRSIEAEIAEAGDQAHALPGDISFPSEVTRLSTAVGEIGALRAAVFNAGNMVRGTALEVTPEAFESTWRGSAYAGFLFVRATLPAGQDGLLHPDAIAETFWHLHQQPRSGWTHELDLRPFKERF